MTQRRNDGYLNTERIFFDMIRDYSTGELSNKTVFFRALVEGVDVQGGVFQTDPPCPPRSIRARVYTSGMDSFIPEDALPIYYPLFPNVSVAPGEHVLVMFEDEQRSSGFWLNTVPAFGADQNYSNPDFRMTTRTNSSYVFEQDPQVQSTIRADEYGGVTTSTQGRQEMIDEAETQQSVNPWQGKRVLIIGDSQIAGPPGIVIASKVRDAGGIVVHREGRESWGVRSWLDNRLRPRDPERVSLRQLVSQHNPDILIISLGGNDHSSSGRNDYAQKVRDLMSQASTVSKILWSGPPTTVNRIGSAIQPGRETAARKIQEVVGNKFLNVFGVTNTTVGRDSAGLHFSSNSPALQPWADLIIEKGRQIF